MRVRCEFVMQECGFPPVSCWSCQSYVVVRYINGAPLGFSQLVIQLREHHGIGFGFEDRAECESEQRVWSEIVESWSAPGPV